jgi:hypothetical protein
MELETQIEERPEGRFCPECGSEESGYFCRSCGALLRGEKMVLCPRCHQVVPQGDYCNQCGQSLSGIALNLRQLAMAGEDFWVTAAAGTSAALAPDSAEAALLGPDESVRLAEADLPDWLGELPTQAAPAEVQARIYPALEPIQVDQASSRGGRFLSVVIALLALLLLSLIALALFFLIQGGL